MLKMFGGLCIMAGGLLLRRQQLLGQKQRRQTLAELLSALRMVMEEIRIAQTPLPVLLEKAARHCEITGRMFSSAAEAADGGESPAASWRAEAEQLPLPEELRKLLGDLGQEFHGDESKICNGISLVIYQLSKYAEQLERERKMDEQRISAVCLSGAALLVILLI